MKIIVPGNTLQITFEVELEQVLKPKPATEIITEMNPRHRKLFRATKCFVQAESEMVYLLCKEHKERGFSETPEDTYSFVVGTLCGKDVPMTLSYWKVAKNTVCFYNMEGLYAIWPFADTFIATAAPFVPKTNAANINYIFDVALI